MAVNPTDKTNNFISHPSPQDGPPNNFRDNSDVNLVSCLGYYSGIRAGDSAPIIVFIPQSGLASESTLWIFNNGADRDAVLGGIRQVVLATSISL